MRTVLSAAIVVAALASRAAAEPLIGLVGSNQLIRFDSASPSTVTAPVSITGGQGGASEVIQGIDVRPRTGGLYALGVVPGATDTLRTYLLDPATGVLTQVGSAVTAQAAGPFYGMDFNPTVDRIRVVNTNDENLRINPNNGSLAGDDSNLNPAGRLIDGVAYDRNFDGHLGASGTTVFGIARNGSQLVRIGGGDQNPSPNTGEVTTVGALGVAPSPASGLGFDISGATGKAYAVMRVGVTTNLYTVSLATGTATLVGAVGNGTLAVRGLAVLSPSRVAFGAGAKNTAVSFDPVVAVPGAPSDAFPRGAVKGVRVAVGDLDRDGDLDLVFAGGGRVPAAVKIVDGQTGELRAQLLAYELNAKVGVQVASGDFDGDGFDDVITAPGPGVTTEVRIFSGATLRLLAAFTPFGSDYSGGASVAAADLDFDGDVEIVVGSGKGLSPEVRVFGGTSLLTLGVFPVLAGTTKGVNVAAATGVPSVIVAGAAGGTPDVVVLKGTASGATAAFSEVAHFTAYAGKKGVRLALLDLDADSAPELFAVPAGGDATCHVFDGTTFAEVQTFTALDAKGAFVAAGR
jgi:hypothetical protein